MGTLDDLGEELAVLGSQNRLRLLRRIEGGPGVRVRVDGRPVINFSSNDYLGLAASDEAAAAAGAASREFGCGATASRLVCGTFAVHAELESALARWQGAEGALLFNSGYQANVGVLSALAGPGDLVVSDQLNHASIIDGCRLSRAEVAIYRHGDAAHAEELLSARGRHARRRFIVSDSLFSMDGDPAPLAELASVAYRQGAALMVDEAHAVGCFGARGRGLAAMNGVPVDILVGTFGKAFGSFGAFVVSRGVVREVLLNRARSFVFTTALPPAVVAASRAALETVDSEEGERLRARLAGLVARMQDGLRRLGLLAEGSGSSPIFPIVAGSEEAAMNCCEQLLERGIFAQAIRPPTVPRGTSRLRMTVTAAHLEPDIDAAVDGLGDLIERGLL